jgi:hypothetical protein
MSRTAYDATVATHGGADSLSPVQRSALRKTAWRFLPLLTIAYLFNYLDRTAIGVAALTMNADLGSRTPSSASRRACSSSPTRCAKYRAISRSTASVRGAGSRAS